MKNDLAPKVLKKFNLDGWKWMVCQDEYGIYLLSQTDNGYWEHSENFDSEAEAMRWANKFVDLIRGGNSVMKGGSYVGYPLYVLRAQA